MSEYSRAKDIVDSALASGQKFTPDTNIIVVLAQDGDQQRLNRFSWSNNFFISITAVNELLKLIRDGDIKGKAARIVDDFVIQCKRLRKVSYDYDPRTEQILEQIVPALPRKLVHNVMISLPSYLVNKLIGKYKELGEKLSKRKLTRKDLDNTADSYKYDNEGLTHDFKKRFHEVCADKRIDESRVDQGKYFAAVENNMRSVLRKIADALHAKQPRGFDDIIRALQEMAAKPYGYDVKIVCHALHSGAILVSLDQDMHFLLVLHACRKVA